MLEFLVTNWLWILLVVAFVVIHRGGHGCGMHGHGHGSNQGTENADGDRNPSTTPM